MKKPYILLALLVVIAALLAGCSEKSPPKQTLVQTPEETPTSLYTPTPVPPTLTPVPLAAQR